MGLVRFLLSCISCTWWPTSFRCHRCFLPTHRDYNWKIRNDCPKKKSRCSNDGDSILKTESWQTETDCQCQWQHLKNKTASVRTELPDVCILFLRCTLSLALICFSNHSLNKKTRYTSGRSILRRLDGGSEEATLLCVLSCWRLCSSLSTVSTPSLKSCWCWVVVVRLEHSQFQWQSWQPFHCTRTRLVSVHLAWPHLRRFSVKNWRLGSVNPGCGHVGLEIMSMLMLVIIDHGHAV